MSALQELNLTRDLLYYKQTITYIYLCVFVWARAIGSAIGYVKSQPKY